MSAILDRAIGQVVSGQAVDWEALQREALDDQERAALDDLRELAMLSDADGPASAAAEETVGTPESRGVPWARWGHLELFEELGRGAHGAVYRAWDTRLARSVALKLLASDEPGRDAIAEARRLASIAHRNVLSVFGADRIDGQIGVWVELIRGRTLEEMLRDQGAFSESEAVGIGLEVCGALAAIHEVGLIHRDLKAQNVMRESGGRLVLMDLGASSPVIESAAPPSLAGTPMYLAPELLEGGRPSPMSDVYAMGVLLYRLVTATFPIEAATVEDVRHAHQAGLLRPLRSVRPDLSVEFVRVVDRCLAADRSVRFASAAAVERDLLAASTARRLERRPWRRAAAAGLIVVALLLGAGLGRWSIAVWRGEGTSAGIGAETYRLLSGYEDLAFARRTTDPAGAAAATNSAISLIRPLLPGEHGIFVLLHSRLEESYRLDGNRAAADASHLDGQAHAMGSVGDTHPYASVLILEGARTDHAFGRHDKVGPAVLHALTLRWRLLGFDSLTGRAEPPLDSRAVSAASARGIGLEDSDGDGLLDAVEAAIGLNPDDSDSDHNGVIDGDEMCSPVALPCRLVFGLSGSPYLTWAQAGGARPATLGWQAPAQFEAVERPSGDERNPAWSVAARGTIAYRFQPLLVEQSRRALARGFSLFARVGPDEGLTSLVIDLAPVGPRFDVFVRRLGPDAIGVSTPTDVLERDGPLKRVEAAAGRWPTIELRYEASTRAASLYADGQLVSAGYYGHHQFQDSQLGAASWGVAGLGGQAGQAASASFKLFWLEIR